MRKNTKNWRLGMTVIMLMLLSTACDNGEKQFANVEIENETAAYNVPLNASARPEPTDSIPPAEPEPGGLPPLRTGKHKLTLQWISWDVPGLR